jgi:DNA mismatch repair protein MutL
MDEMKELIRLLEKAEMPHTCPHGRPVMITIPEQRLLREFGRLG